MLHKTDWEPYKQLSRPEEVTAQLETQFGKSEIEQLLPDASHRTNATACVPVGVANFLKGASDDGIVRNENTTKRSYKGLICQICKYEGRSNTSRWVSYCHTHRLRMCTSTAGKRKYQSLEFEEAILASREAELGTWLCPQQDWTCWEKAHKYYIPQGLFGNDFGGGADNQKLRTKSVKTNSDIYRRRQKWMYDHGLLETNVLQTGKSKSNKRKRDESPTGSWNGDESPDARSNFGGSIVPV